MINLVKAQLYRLLKSKTYRNSAIAVFVITIFILGYSIFTKGDLWLMSFMGMDNIRRGFSVGLQSDAGFRDLLVNALGSGAAIYIIAIVLTISVVFSKKRSGMMKNTVSYGYERWKIYLSEVISLIAAISILIIAPFLTILFVTAIVYRVSIINYEVIKYLILYIVIVSSTISIYVLLANILPSSELVSAIVIIELIAGPIVAQFLSTEVNTFIPYSMIRNLAQVSGNINFILYLGHGILIMFVSTVLGIIIFNKREIK